jgi:hypothetical protein
MKKKCSVTIAGGSLMFAGVSEAGAKATFMPLRREGI